MSHDLKSTRQAAAALNVAVYQVNYLLRLGHVRPSLKDVTGRWWWSEADIEAARAAMLKLRRKAAS